MKLFLSFAFVVVSFSYLVYAIYLLCEPKQKTTFNKGLKKFESNFKELEKSTESKNNYTISDNHLYE
ncbi:MAG: hypothetical protein Wins2KO_02040 [Winogradskyella sp.]